MLHLEHVSHPIPLLFYIQEVSNFSIQELIADEIQRAGAGGDFGGIDFSKLGGAGGLGGEDEEEEEEGEDDDDMPPLEGEEAEAKGDEKPAEEPKAAA